MSPHRLIACLLFLMTGMSTGFAQSEKYVRIAISNADYVDARNFLEVDHVHREGDRTIVEIPGEDQAALDQSGVLYEVLVEDLTAHYREQNKTLDFRSQVQLCGNEPTTPQHFRLGSMGGYLTLDELMEELERMHELFPDLINPPLPISQFKTHEGRPIVWTKISGKGQGEKKGVLYTALHHAREPLSMQQLVYFMWYMLENYHSDPQIKHILDHTNLYFIPCVNPDGYAYNARMAPDGGGMWRKNRRPLGGEHFGVDLNRNYGYKWGYNSVGSSNDPTSELYRGPSAFSEPETQAVKWFCENHEIYSALNYHSFGDFLIYPWGYSMDSNPHEKHFQSPARSLTFEKRILHGTSTETVLYSTNGDTDDWMYGETESKQRIFSMTPEVGPGVFGFWPKKSHIERLCARELQQNIRMAMAPHGSVMVVPTSDPIFYSSRLQHKFYLYPVTLEDGVVQSKITPLTDNIVHSPESFYYFGLENQQEYVVDIDLRPGMADGEVVQFVMTLDNGTLAVIDTMTYIYSTRQEEIDVLTRAADIDSWVRSSHSSNSWGTTTAEYYTAPSSITDSPKGLYNTSTENFIISSQSYRIPQEEEVYLTFKAKWDITYGVDYAQLSISTDGVRFTPLCGNLTTEHYNYDGVVSPVYTGVQDEWLTECISLNPYRGKDVYFKWNLVSESADARDGIFVDDMKITYSQTITPNRDELLTWGEHEFYPNPVSDGVLHLKVMEKTGNQLIAGYEIRNQLGQLMKKGEAVSGLNTLEVGQYPPGMYLLQLITRQGQRLKAQKFVVLP